jgi:hypothetical protein
VVIGAVSVLAAPDAALSRTVDGVAIYLGVVPSAVAFERAGAHPEAVAHGSRWWRGKASQHLTVALYDARSGSRIGDAEATFEYSRP